MPAPHEPETGGIAFLIRTPEAVRRPEKDLMSFIVPAQYLIEIFFVLLGKADTADWFISEYMQDLVSTIGVDCAAAGAKRFFLFSVGSRHSGFSAGAVLFVFIQNI